MLFGMLLCISFSKAVLWLTIDGDEYKRKKFPVDDKDISFVTRAEFLEKCDDEEMKFLESKELTKLLEIEFKDVKNETDKCLLLDGLNAVKNAHANEKKISNLTVHVKELSQDHLNIIKELSSTENLTIKFSTSEKNLNLSLANLGQNLNFLEIKHLELTTQDIIKKITLEGCESLKKLEHLSISDVNVEFDDYKLAGEKIIRLLVEYNFPELDITPIKEILKNCKKLESLSILQNIEKPFDIFAECPNLKKLQSLVISHSSFSYKDAKRVKDDFVALENLTIQYREIKNNHNTQKTDLETNNSWMKFFTEECENNGSQRYTGKLETLAFLSGSANNDKNMEIAKSLIAGLAHFPTLKKIDIMCSNNRELCFTERELDLMLENLKIENVDVLLLFLEEGTEFNIISGKDGKLRSTIIRK